MLCYQVLPWRELVMPSVHLARYGFEGEECLPEISPGEGRAQAGCADTRRFRLVNEDLVRYMKSATEDGNFLVDDPIWAEDFAPNGECFPDTKSQVTPP